MLAHRAVKGQRAVDMLMFAYSCLTVKRSRVRDGDSLPLLCHISPLTQMEGIWTKGGITNMHKNSHS